MRLDSIPTMKTAQKLYESIGFYEIPDYRNNPNKGTKYYELTLGDNASFLNMIAQLQRNGMWV